MTRIVLIALVILSPALALAQTGGATPTAALQPPPVVNPPVGRFRDFMNHAVLSPEPYVLALGAGVIDQMLKMPGEWTGSNQFAKRSGARLGSGFASDVIGHSVAAVLKHQVAYEPCECAGPWSRTKHAVGRGFATRHDDGHMVPNVSIFVAKFGAAGLANTWYPPSYTGVDVVREGFAGIGINAGLNIAREFAPELLRLVPFR
jgi:hypothetical protein